MHADNYESQEINRPVEGMQKRQKIDCNQYDISTIPTSVVDFLDRIYLCDFDGCEKRFKRADHLRRHQRSVHTGARPFSCKKCEKSFSSKEHLLRHDSFVHMRNFACDIQGCTRTFSNESRLICHKAKDHTKTLPYPCPINGCSVAFDFASRLKSHMRSHNKVLKKKYICGSEGCLEDFVKKSELYKHLKIQHNHILSVVTSICEVCGKEFQKKSMKRHLDTHEPNKPVFICDVDGCSKILSSKPNLESHQKRIHEGKVVKFPCSHPGCCKQFWSSSRLENHILKHHSENPPPKKQRHKRSIFEVAFGFSVQPISSQQ